MTNVIDLSNKRNEKDHREIRDGLKDIISFYGPAWFLDTIAEWCQDVAEENDISDEVRDTAQTSAEAFRELADKLFVRRTGVDV